MVCGVVSVGWVLVIEVLDKVVDCLLDILGCALVALVQKLVGFVVGGEQDLFGGVLFVVADSEGELEFGVAVGSPFHIAAVVGVHLGGDL